MLSRISHLVYKVTLPSGLFNYNLPISFCFLCLMLFTTASQATPYEASDIYEMAHAQIPISEDIDINTLTYDDTALRIAVRYDAVEAAVFLLAQGADIHTELPMGYIQKGSLLHDVKSCEMAQLLLDHGADLNSQASIEHTTPLYEAIARQNKALVDFFMEQGAELNRGTVAEHDPAYFLSNFILWFLFDSEFGRPLCHDILNQSTQLNTLEDLIFILPIVGVIQYIFKVQQAGDLTVEQACMMAGFALLPANMVSIGTLGVFKEREASIKEFLKNLNFLPQKIKDTPLNIAIKTKDKALIETLIDKGIDVNSTGTMLRTAVIFTIMTYCHNEDEAIEILRLLIEHGADIWKNYTVPHFAPDAHRYFKGVKLKCFSSALDVAHQLGCKKIETFLMEQDVEDPMASMDVTQAFCDKEEHEIATIFPQQVRARLKQPKARLSLLQHMKKSLSVFDVKIRNSAALLR